MMLVLLDRQLPDGDGLALLPKLRAGGNAVPVLVLMARGDMVDRVIGLDHGADDYLAKPFAFEELLAWLRALLRRSPNIQSDIVRVGHLAFDFAQIGRPAFPGKGSPCRVASCSCSRPWSAGWGAWYCAAPSWRRFSAWTTRSSLTLGYPCLLGCAASWRIRTAGATIDGVRGVGYLIRETPENALFAFPQAPAHRAAHDLPGDGRDADRRRALCFGRSVRLQRRSRAP